MKKKTVGQVSVELSQKEPDNIPVMEQQEAMQGDYMKNLLDCIDVGFKKYNNSFFVEVITKKEPLMQNVLRNYFIERSTCPTPNYDQSVFRYNKEKERVEYIWTIPSRDTCFHLRDNFLEIHADEKQLLNFVLMFEDGTLFKMCKKWNGEQYDSPLLEKGN